MKRIKKTFHLSPPQILVSGFALIILLGAFLLTLPIASTGEPVTFINALFTATSATCVTGLIVEDTGIKFTMFGQIVIASLVQIGGLGFMTMATLIALAFKKRISFRERLILKEALNQISVEGIVRLIRRAIIYSLLIEAMGAVIFAIRWSFEMPLGKAIYFGVFHAVAIFNNAGYDLFGHYGSFTPFVDDITINVVAMLLVVLGGIGFIVMADVMDYKHTRRLSLHTKVVISMTSILIVLGAFIIFIFEFTNPNTMGPLSWPVKVLSSFFQSVTTRSLGVNTVDIGNMRQATQFFMLILMFIGAAPGSTGGGIKVTTFAILIGAVIAMIRGKEDIVMFRYRLAKGLIFKAITLTFLAISLTAFVAMLLSTTEPYPFLMILFEVISAFGTVGLSMGLTEHLTMFGKIIIVLLMFMGRLGPLTLAYALGSTSQKELYRHPEGKITIG